MILIPILISKSSFLFSTWATVHPIHQVAQKVGTPSWVVVRQAKLRRLSGAVRFVQKWYKISPKIYIHISPSPKIYIHISPHKTQKNVRMLFPPLLQFTTEALALIYVLGIFSCFCKQAERDDVKTEGPHYFCVDPFDETVFGKKGAWYGLQLITP